jgi:hypothetical protein
MSDVEFCRTLVVKRRVERRGFHRLSFRGAGVILGVSQRAALAGALIPITGELNVFAALVGRSGAAGG